MKNWVALIGLAGAGASLADDVKWTPAQQIQTTRNVAGVVAVPVESADWQGLGPKPAPAAKLGALTPPKPIAVDLPLPRELPEIVQDLGPILPPPMKLIEPVKPIAPTPPPAPLAPVVATTKKQVQPAQSIPATRPYRPQPWAAPSGGRSFENNPLGRLILPR